MGMSRTPLLFPVIYLFLYFSHQSTLWLNVSLILRCITLCCVVFFRACLLHLTSAHLPVLSDFISHLFYSLSAFFDFVSLSLSSLPLSSCTSLISLLSSSLSRLYSFCFSPAVSCLLLLYTHMHTSAHLCACPWQCGGVASLTLNIKEEFCRHG